MTTAPHRTHIPTPPLVSGAGQVWLVGEEVYLRPPAPADAEYAVSWRLTRFPLSPDRVRAQIAAGETGDDAGPDRSHVLIVRRADDRPVGSLLIHTDFPRASLEATVDPIFTTDAARWKGEAVAMAMRHVVDEWQTPIATVMVPADERTVVDALARAGARQSIRFRQAQAREGARIDVLMYECLSPAWIDRLGDPAERELPRSGTGEPRPVTPPVVPDGDPPANAVRIGPRVYLRPLQQGDARPSAHWAAREVDASWGNGRFIFGAGEFWSWVREDQVPMPARVDFAVCLRESDEPIGFVGVLEIDRQHRFGVTASELMDPAYRGGGYGSEAKHLLFDHAFNTLGLHVLQSWVLFENTRSAAALRKQGYREAGRGHWFFSRDGAFTSMCAFDLLADEWGAMPRRPQGVSE